ncbi:hypothetical protein GCM10023336_21410 [Streptomyces similanensis]|uniref:Uncharacterized protein n=1 Tax=Streptomyces similanensis TaxID=1274988 RepID=A0ABP9K639_9ACTN
MFGTVIPGVPVADALRGRPASAPLRDTEAGDARTPHALPHDRLSGLLRTGGAARCCPWPVMGRGLRRSRLQNRLRLHGAPVAAAISAW